MTTHRGDSDAPLGESGATGFRQVNNVTAKKREVIRISAYAGVGLLILLVQLGRWFVARFGPHPVRAARGIGADVATLIGVIPQALGFEEEVQQEGDILVEALVATVAAATAAKNTTTSAE